MFGFHKGFIFALSTMVIWGIGPIFAKLGVRGASAMNAFEIRSIGVVLSFLIYSVISGQIIKYPGLLTADLKTTGYLFIEGFLGAFLGQVTYYHAQKYWEASKTVAIVSAFPVVTLILATVILNEMITLRKCAGVLLIICGFYLIK